MRVSSDVGRMAKLLEMDVGGGSVLDPRRSELGRHTEEDAGMADIDKDVERALGGRRVLKGLPISMSPMSGG